MEVGQGQPSEQAGALVRRVTERNAGHLTAGVDGEVALTDETKTELVSRVHDPGPVPGRESGLTRSGESVKRKKPVIPEPEDKLDAATNVAVSGPEDAMLDWRQLDWRQVEENVRRLRQRIFTASKAGDLPRVRRLQKLMLRSRSNTLLSRTWTAVMSSVAPRNAIE
jgi:hypothetical protein